MDFLTAISHLQSDGFPPPFMKMLSKLHVQVDKTDSIDEGLLKMMEGMMSTLLSREVLYPSLQDFVRQVQYCSIVVYGHQKLLVASSG